MRPRLLDLFCGAGGASAGYYRAGFDVVGIDIDPQPNYPFKFMQRDLTAFDDLEVFGEFDAYHASPPCQAFSDLQVRTNKLYPDLIPHARELLQATDKPYVIENVDRAPLLKPIRLCGTMFPELRVLRHRLFESNAKLTAPPHGKHPKVFTTDKRKPQYGQLDQDTAYIQVTGGGNATLANKQAAMGINWMTGGEINEAIPPAYAEYVGGQLL